MSLREILITFNTQVIVLNLTGHPMGYNVLIAKFNVLKDMHDIFLYFFRFLFYKINPS